MLSWETGLALGLFVGYTFLYDRQQLLLTISLLLVAVALLLYNFFTHRWFISHKNR